MPEFGRLPRVAFVRVRGGDVIKYRPYEFFLVAVYLHPVLELPDESDRRLMIKRLVEARLALTTFTGDLIDRYLPISKRRAEEMIKDIDDITLFHKQDAAGIPNLQTVQASIKKFEPILDEEVSAAPIFCLERIGNLSTENLLAAASKGYDQAAIQALDDRCIAEIDEAGRCLAFERPTASGFHILRAVELTIRLYLSRIVGFVLPPLNRQNWGEFIKLLKDNNAAKEVIDSLQNIKDNYRNPLMHPMDTLELRQAISLFCVCQGMIEALVADMKKRGLIA
jgi:hypothetical protein